MFYENSFNSTNRGVHEAEAKKLLYHETKLYQNEALVKAKCEYKL